MDPYAGRAEGRHRKVIGPPPPPNSAALGGALRTLRKVRAKAEGHKSVEEHSSIALDRASGDVLRNAHAEAMRMSMPSSSSYFSSVVFSVFSAFRSPPSSFTCPEYEFPSFPIFSFPHL